MEILDESRYEGIRTYELTYQVHSFAPQKTKPKKKKLKGSQERRGSVLAGLLLRQFLGCARYRDKSSGFILWIFGI